MQEESQNDARLRNDLIVAGMTEQGALRSAEIERAFRTVLRHHFLPALSWDEAYQDHAIGTHFEPEQVYPISSSCQPTMMAIILEQLHVAPGMKVLEFGAGTGYNAALLAELIGDPGLVWTVDVDEEFCAEVRQHLQAAGYAGVQVMQADGWRGYADAAPYDRIIVTAAAHDIAPAWLEQLTEGGILVLSWGSALQRALALRKEGAGLILESSAYCGFMPMRGEFAGTPPPQDDLLVPYWPLSCAALEALPQADLGDLCFFLAVQEMRLVPPSAMNAVRAGGPKLAVELESLIRDWIALGQPAPDRMRLTAYRQGTSPHPRQDQRFVRRTWFDYLISWA